MESLLQRYRRDRRKLLDFILSSASIHQIPTSSAPTANVSDSDLDVVSADYVLDCLKSGGVVDISEATKRYYEESARPVMIHSQLGDSYFLSSDPDLAESPPRRLPPRIHVNQSTNHASSSSENIAMSRDGHDLKYTATTSTPLKPVENLNIFSLGLPILNTGLSDDDLRESAYEIMLASIVFSGVQVYTVQDRKKEKSSKFLSGFKGKMDKAHLQSQSLGRHSELIDTIRVQMQISEVMDLCMRQKLMQFATRKLCDRIDIPQISLGLLNSIFKSDFVHEKSYMQWKYRQANILEEVLYFFVNLKTAERLTIKSSLAKIRNTKEWDFIMPPSERAEVLLAMKEVASKLASVPGQFGIHDETCYWTAGYHLNIRIYEKLLFGMFDVLDEGQLIEEADEILMLIKLTWSTLGINQRMHNVLYGWVLFQQFVGTDEATLLEYAILEVQQVLSTEDIDGKEEQYMNSLVCSRVFNGKEKKLSLVEAIFFSMSIWCDSKLLDYHLHFSKLTKTNGLDEIAAKKLKTYIQKSIEAAYSRVAATMDLESKLERTHPLALLANELRLIANRELTVFCPILRHWCPEAGMISAMLLNQLYGERLKPFLKGVMNLSEDVKLVLPAADMLDHDLTQLYSSACKDHGSFHPFDQDFDHYEVGEISRPIILDWVIAQHGRILEWTGRAFDLEDWEPLSSQQRQAVSVVEVFRIVEETVDQFFGLNLPMDITHLQALLSVIFHSLDTYLQKVISESVEKSYLFPPAPSLTRYKEMVIPIAKKKLVESTPLDEKVNNKLNELTISKLCVRLNTLQYIQKQMRTLEDGIRKSWALVRPSANQRWTKEESLENLEESSMMSSESIDELFATTFNIIRDTATDAINKICDFIGTKVVFWDLRDSFLFRLYRGNVEDARLDSILPHVDTVLDRICDLIDDALRDLVVLSICQAALEAFVWVLLDGGPSRAFSDSDIPMMEDDLNMLKDLFVADGEGLPRSLVQKKAEFAEQILSLFALQTGTVIQMLMTASEHISTGLDSRKHGRLCLGDAQTLVRVLCHKKDREASKFLKRQYQLPMSSEYDDTPSKDSTLRSPLISDLIKRSASFHWTEKGQSSFISLKKKLQEATSEIRW
ncbi:protein unc-13 homolog isoform X2 [Vitis riparia]|uniref:protein unc-13 homolog isoform X2 n=1 Tax=Vitis riparia TaxID=96939 RepID=UPI00155AB6C2|nr:protein unc-13 homolog isoform X2 [Vitis riparia]